jgi:hypothetical protein
LIVAEKNATKNILDRRKDRGKTVYSPPPPGSGGITSDIQAISNNILRVFSLL